MKRIYSVLVENRSGVLAKVAGLFWRRCFNIDSLTVGETEDSAVSNMVIVSSGEERTLEQVEKQLNKKLDIIKVRTFTENQGLCRELLMVKLGHSQMIIEMCDTPERINMFLDTLKSVSILECARTGTLAMLKISESENK